jgi:hypothetical protein
VEQEVGDHEIYLLFDDLWLGDATNDPLVPQVVVVAVVVHQVLEVSTPAHMTNIGHNRCNQ